MNSSNQTTYSPTAIRMTQLSGKTAFAARDNLRRLLREFTKPIAIFTRVLIVRGDDRVVSHIPGNFCTIWPSAVVGAQPMGLRLRKNLIFSQGVP